MSTLGGVHHLRSGREGYTPSQVEKKGYPIPGPDGRVPWGLPSVQDWMRYLPHPDLGWGYSWYPHPRLDGVPPQTWDGGTLHPRLDGVPTRPHPGYPSIQDWMGYPTPHPDLGWGYTPPISKASTCYAAGSVPLAFTQEDFLVEIQCS